jgi:hypothetical protein
MARNRGPGDSTPSKDDRTRYVIKYISCTGEFYRGASGRFDRQPIERVTARGANARKVTADAIREAGGRVVSVRRAGWFW